MSTNCKTNLPVDSWPPEGKGIKLLIYQVLHFLPLWRSADKLILQFVYFLIVSYPVWAAINLNSILCKLESCPYWTKTCPHWTCFGTNYPKNGVGLALTFDKNFKFSKVLLSSKFKHNSMSMAVTKKNFYYMFNLTFDRVNIPLQSMVNDVVENFFLHFYDD